MAKHKATKKSPKPVEAIVHGDKRKNLPTADAHDFVTLELEKPMKLLYPRRPELDPQLVWKGKDGLDERDHEVEAPPIYIQEKIDPRVLIENLRRTAKAGQPEPEATLFDTFDGLGDLDLVEFYKHDANWSNRMILGDSLQVMASLAEREALRGKMQMVYIDPPYGIRFGSNWQSSVKNRDVRDGRLEDASREVETIRAFRDTWELGIHSYLSYLRDRITAASDLLTDSGSLFVQIGDENVHLVRAVLDEVLGSDNFCSHITFRKTSAVSSPVARLNVLASAYDHLLWYAKDITQVKYRQLFLRKELGGPGGTQYSLVELPDGSYRRMTRDEKKDLSLIPDGARIFGADNLMSPGHSAELSKEFEFEGATFSPGANKHWKTTLNGMRRLGTAGRLIRVAKNLSYKRYLSDFPVYPMINSWSDTSSSFMESKWFVVQTTPKVIERCMLMTTDPGDLVLDPTCGSGTTAFVAEEWGRRWITIDTSRVALAIARQRLLGARYPYYVLADSEVGRRREEELAGAVLPVAAVGNDIRHGFVYERVPHVTLKSIANNPDLTEGVSRDDMEAAILRHADYELLYDRPIEDPARVRVAGPLTVESLSPHRSLAFAAPGESAEPGTERDAATDPSAPSFEQTIMANLQAAGIQNGKRKERLALDLVEAYAGTHIQAVGTRADPEAGTPARVGFSIGPQYGTVGPSFIREAAREANKASDMDLLCVLGFAFDPNAIGATEEYMASDEGFASVAAERQLGRVPVLLVRMNADLVMGEELKKTGAGNLFTVFGEPDMDISKNKAGNFVVTLRGVDVYDPTTGEVRSNDTDQIAMWMIDTNYNGESFFVRECYFTGGNDPYKRLKTALKAEIDEDAWATLYRTESRPFPAPETGKIAVKVINDYGDEVLKVFDLN